MEWFCLAFIDTLETGKHVNSKLTWGISSVGISSSRTVDEHRHAGGLHNSGSHDTPFSRFRFCASGVCFWDTFGGKVNAQPQSASTRTTTNLTIIELQIKLAILYDFSRKWIGTHKLNRNRNRSEYTVIIARLGIYIYDRGGPKFLRYEWIRDTIRLHLW